MDTINRIEEDGGTMTDEQTTAVTGKTYEYTQVWISALIPAVGADTYDGVRVSAFLTEEDCYRDLADWLEIFYESNAQVAAALDEAVDWDDDLGIKCWKVEEQRIYA